MKKTNIKKIVKYILIILLITAVGYIMYINRSSTFKIEENGFSIRYSARYKPVDESERVLNDSKALEVRNKNNGVAILVQKVDGKSSDKSLDELMENYSTTLRVFNLDYPIDTLSKEKLKFGNIEAGRVENVIRFNKDNNVKIITVLMPLENAEITITIRGQEKNVDKNIKEINKIIKSIKIN